MTQPPSRQSISGECGPLPLQSVPAPTKPSLVNSNNSPSRVKEETSVRKMDKETVKSKLEELRKGTLVLGPPSAGGGGCFSGSTMR